MKHLLQVIYPSNQPQSCDTYPILAACCGKGVGEAVGEGAGIALTHGPVVIRYQEEGMRVRVAEAVTPTCGTVTGVNV